MAKPISFGQFELNLGSKTGAEGSPSERAPFRLLVMGDFSGRHNRGVRAERADLAQQPTYSIDPDTFEEVMARLGVSLRLELSGAEGAQVELGFRELDDFHPDRIFGETEVFAELRNLRRRLLNSATFAEAAAEMTGPATAAPPEPTETTAEPPTVDELSSTGLLDTLLDETAARGTQQSERGQHGPWHRLVRSIVEPYLIPAADPRQADMVASVDEATGETMRRVLHHPDLQSLEAAWRGVYFLLRRLVVDRELQLHLFDISRDELLADLLEGEQLEQTALCKLLVDRTIGTAGGEPWSAVVADFTFGTTAEDVEALGRWARLASVVRAPVIAGGVASIVGCASLEQTPDPADWGDELSEEVRDAWNALRQLPEAAYAALVLPRILLRLPYGPQTVPIESFRFEELDARAPHDSYLWGNGAWACGLVLAQAFEQQGWRFRPGVVNTIEGLPLHVYRRDGDAEQKPCGELLLTDRAAERIHEAGLTSIQSIRGRDAVQLMRIRSLSATAPALAGRWAG